MIQLTHVSKEFGNKQYSMSPLTTLTSQTSSTLKKVLAGYQGTLIVISHDVDFLRNTTNKTLEIVDRHINVHAGAPKK